MLCVSGGLGSPLTINMGSVGVDGVSARHLRMRVVWEDQRRRIPRLSANYIYFQVGRRAPGDKATDGLS